jgi:hypothetical protein
MEMTVLTMLRAPVMREFDIDKYGFAMVGSVIFGGMLVGKRECASARTHWHARTHAHTHSHTHTHTHTHTQTHTSHL